MGKIHNLKQELATIENTVADLSKQLLQNYSNYLNLLGQSIKKQLILATYQVCTQSYPREFLNLSYSQQEQVQESIKMLAKKGQEKLLYILEKSYQNLLNMQEEDSSPENSEKKITDPETLMNWSNFLEQEINSYLDRLSMKVNQVLQQAKILPQRLPAQIIEMAMQAEEVGQSIGGTPNLLNVLIEAERRRREEEEEEESHSEEENDAEDEEEDLLDQITRLTAIRLRLIEIEFADPALSAGRNQIRQLLERINQVRKHYHRKQKECAIAEAEAAWRACWTDN